MKIPMSHPRAESLLVREKLVEGFKRGLVAKEGLLAHGRGEMFDYMIGEKTTKSAKRAISAAAARLLLAERPVISVNGNVAALCPKEVVLLSRATGARIEVNIFYASRTRRQNIARELKKYKAIDVLGNREKHSKKLPGLDGARRIVDVDGIYQADVVLVPLEDGDRTEALVKAGKDVITFDLNPMSRTAQKSTITIVDNIVRAIKHVTAESERLSRSSHKRLQKIVDDFDNKKNLASSILEINTNLKEKARRCTRR